MNVNLDNIKAIRSLACEDHAHNIVPTVLEVEWMITRRCNYDCSYCFPHYHDFISPYIDEEKALIFVDKINLEVTKQNKKVAWKFTGGEPFIDPGFLPLIEKLSKLESTSQMGVVSNGSVSLDQYIRACEYLTNLTISLHLERNEKETNKTLEKIIEINKINNLFFNVNLMFLPGELEKVKEIISLFKENNVKFVLRKITPRIDVTDDQLHYTKTGKHGKLKSEQDQQSAVRNYKEKSDIILTDVEKNNYYSDDELEFLKNNYKKPVWQNVGVWDTDNNYTETNTDKIIAKHANKFKNWICFVGVDSVYIDCLGNFYQGVCMNDGKQGNIYEDSSFFQKKFTVCKRNWCNCSSVMTVRKCKNNNDLNLIGETQ